MTAQAVVFLRPGGADGLGHVGFGFNLPSPQWIVGALENPSGWPVALPGGTGFWYREVADGAAAMAGMANPPSIGSPAGCPPYTSAKILYVINPNPQAAQAKMQEWAGRTYTAVGGNCMNCVYDVLTAFGAVLPDPTPNPDMWVPNEWFRAISGEIASA